MLKFSRRCIRLLPSFSSQRPVPLFPVVLITLLVWSMPVAADEPDSEPPLESGAVFDDDGLTIETDDEELRLHITGRFQLRYGFESERGEPDRSALYFPRIQPNIEGSALSDDLTFRLRPDISRDATLRDAFVSYRFDDGFQLRAGQFNVPFHWERHLPPTRQQFVERSAANNEFQWTTGRDVGLMAHGDPTDRIRYGVGVFNGEGRNEVGPESTGHMVTGRLVVAPLGEYETSEVPLTPADEINLAIGAGGYAAFDNASRDWSFTPGFEVPEADVYSATSDVHLRWDRLSMHLTGFVRHVDPQVAIPTDVSAPPQNIDTTPGLASTQGLGWSAHLGALFIPERLFAALRYGQVDADVDDPFRRHELTGGLQIFHRGHHSKFHLESGVEFTEGTGDGHDLFLVRAQYQFLF